MKAAVTTAPNSMELQEVDRPIPGRGEALVAVEAVGVCGSDFHLYAGRHPYAHFPQIQGHEVVGRIAEFGPGYDGPLSVGERVVVEPFIACGRCFACRHGHPNCCVSLAVMGAHIPGALREYVTAGTSRLYPTGELPLLASVLVEPLTIGLQCVVRGNVSRDDTVMVIGAGPIGLAATVGAVDRGARVLVVDRVPGRLRYAERLGAAATVNTSTEDLAGAAEEFTGGEGVAVVIEATGVPGLVHAALDAVAHSGTVVIVGISDGEVSIPVGLFSRKEINILGSRNNVGLFPVAIRLARRHADQLTALVTHTYALDETRQAIEYAMAHPDEVEKAIVLIGKEQE